MPGSEFVLPITYDLIATFLFAVTGALVAAKKGFDPLGVGLIAVISGAGGGIIRDAIFLNMQPAFISDWRYITAVFLALVTVLIGRSILRARFIGIVVILIDAIGLGMYGVFGAQKSLAFGLSIFAAIIVGTVNATGGGLLRDVVMSQNPKSLLPGQLYGILSVAAILLFLLLHIRFDMTAHAAAWIAIGVCFIIRLLAIKFDWRTRAVSELSDPSEILVNQIKPLPQAILESRQRVLHNTHKSESDKILPKHNNY